MEAVVRAMALAVLAVLGAVPARAETPVHLGSSVTGGLVLRSFSGVLESAPALDLLDVELHIGRVQVVPRLGRFLVGRLALHVTDAEIPVLVRLDDEPPAGWSQFAAVGGAPRLVVGAGLWRVGGRGLARVGVVHQQERRRTWFFVEPHVGVDGGSAGTTADLGLRVGIALTGRVSP